MLTSMPVLVGIFHFSSNRNDLGLWELPGWLHVDVHQQKTITRGTLITSFRKTYFSWTNLFSGLNMVL